MPPGTRRQLVRIKITIFADGTIELLIELP